MWRILGLVEVKKSRGGSGAYIDRFWSMWQEVVLCIEASVVVD